MRCRPSLVVPLPDPVPKYCATLLVSYASFSRQVLGVLSKLRCTPQATQRAGM